MTTKERDARIEAIKVEVLSLTGEEVHFRGGTGTHQVTQIGDRPVLHVGASRLGAFEKALEAARGGEQRNTGETIIDEQQIRDLAEEWGAEGWRREPTGFDWETFLEDMEKRLKIELPDQMDDPLIVRIQRWARAAWREANA
jgi:hypothetical protein